MEDQYIGSDQIKKYAGDYKGIQGQWNSSYIDATVFALFALSDTFDSLFLHKLENVTPSLQLEIMATEQPLEIGYILSMSVVNPLRKSALMILGHAFSSNIVCQLLQN